MADLSIEQLVSLEVASVYGASRYEQRVARAPSAVSVITSEDIKKYGHRTLADVLNSVRGLYVSSDRNYSYVGFRGFLRPGDYNTKVLLLVDGHPLNDGVYDSAYYGHEAVVDVDVIDRVEVIRGPSSSVYGSSAFFGVINVVTDNGVGIETGNLTRIFSHGFTTRTGGHGYGLHSGWLAAREMKGSLSVQSAGPGRGATFTLELPLVTRPAAT